MTQCGVLALSSVNKLSSSSASLITPNPTTGALRISYTLPAPATVSLQVFATDGSLVLSPMKAQLRETGDASFAERLVVR